jgi:hypothetical protein
MTLKKSKVRNRTFSTFHVLSLSNFTFTLNPLLNSIHCYIRSFNVDIEMKWLLKRLPVAFTTSLFLARSSFHPRVDQPTMLTFDPSRVAYHRQRVLAMCRWSPKLHQFTFLALTTHRRLRCTGWCTTSARIRLYTPKRHQDHIFANYAKINLEIFAKIVRLRGNFHMLRLTITKYYLSCKVSNIFSKLHFFQ